MRSQGPRVERLVRVAVGTTDIRVRIHVNTDGGDEAKVQLADSLTTQIGAIVNHMLGVQTQIPAAMPTPFGTITGGTQPAPTSLGASAARPVLPRPVSA